MSIEISMMDYIRKVTMITKKEFTEAMQSGDTDLKEEALERMALAGGYEALEEE